VANSGSLCLCEDHFLPENIGQRYLKKGAIPVLSFVETNGKGGEYRRGRAPVSTPSKKKNSIRVSGGILPPMP